MRARPLLLDLFACAGGAGVGYGRAGFRVVGVDLVRSPNNPHHVLAGDALRALERWGRRVDAIHASPPCQSHLRGYNGQRVDRAPSLIPEVREGLKVSGRPWVMENVQEAPLVNAVVLCGLMFGLKVLRHRAFESELLLLAPPHPGHPKNARAAGLHWGAAGHNQYAGHTLENVAEAMGVDWKVTRHELNQAIPPAYTQYLGRQLMVYLGRAAKGTGCAAPENEG
jgi:DNA (cytosine-5)-methyltransferase 1